MGNHHSALIAAADRQFDRDEEKEPGCHTARQAPALVATGTARALHYRRQRAMRRTWSAVFFDCCGSWGACECPKEAA